MSKVYKVAVVGATGLVGSKMIEVLSEHKFPVGELVPVASERSAGKIINFNGKEFKVVTPAEGVAAKPDIALFSAGGETSRVWAPEFAKAGAVVIDSSSLWRMDPSVKLVVPEVNGDILDGKEGIIANPNCSTIQMLVPLWPLHKLYKIKRIVVSTYQSVTGSGMKGINQMTRERAGVDTALVNGVPAYHYPIDKNIIPHIDSFADDDYTKEEWKMVNETHKIFNDYSIGVSATTVRVPVTGGHSESVNVEFEKEYDLKEVFEVLKKTQGVIVQDNPAENVYPMPLFAFGKDEVFVGRIRRDRSVKSGLNLWVVADNLRKGAATNAVQIAEQIIKLK